MIDLYNGFSLCLADRDATRTYGGKVRAPGDAGSADHVAQLRKDLQELGFYLAKPLANEKADLFDGWLEETVREFQVMARQACAAVEAHEPVGNNKYLLRLKTVVVPEDERYPAPDSGAEYQFATGVVNDKTRELIALWKKNRWRCPWVIAEWGVPAKNKPPLKSVKPKPRPSPPSPDEWVVGERTFKRHDLTVTGRTPKVTGEVFLHDFAQTYFSDADPSRPDMRFYLGKEWGLAALRGPTGTPGLPDTQRRLIKITPELLTGGPINDPSSAAASTFRVVAGVASLEASFGFQCVNGWDLAVISAGLYHFALMSKKTNEDLTINFGKGELLGLLSWMEKMHPEEFADYVGTFGLRSALTWGTDGSALRNPRNGIWESYLCRETVGGLRADPVEAHQRVQVMQSWQWLARFNMLAFVSPGYAKANWTLARLRLHFICALPIGGKYPKTWRIGDVFSSERLIAKLLRVHVLGSGRLSLLPKGKPVTCAKWIPKLLDKHLTDKEIQAGPDAWDSAVLVRLEKQLDASFKSLSEPKTGKDGTKHDGDFARLTHWKFEGRLLDTSARSFKLLTDGLDLPT